MNLLMRQNFKENVRLFKSVKRKLRCILGEDIFMEHIGSTALKRMWGKNIIDVLIGAKNLQEVEKMARKLEKHKFFRGRNHASGSYIFLASRQSETKSGDVHLHVVVEQTETFCDFLSVKAYLCANPAVAANYVACKRLAAQEAQNDRARYKALKSIYMTKIVEEAKQWSCTQKATTF